MPLVLNEEQNMLKDAAKEFAAPTRRSRNCVGCAMIR